MVEDFSHLRYIDEALEMVPPNWYWSIVNGPIKGKHKVGKKYRDARYTIYMSNGEMFATPFYTSVWVDGDVIIECIDFAILEVKRIEKEKRDEAERLRNKIQRKDVEV